MQTAETYHFLNYITLFSVFYKQLRYTMAMQTADTYHFLNHITLFNVFYKQLRYTITGSINAIRGKQQKQKE